MAGMGASLIAAKNETGLPQAGCFAALAMTPMAGFS